MSVVGGPSIDYRRFLSDAGSGLVALVSLAIVIYICGSNGECRFEFVTMLYEYFTQIFSPLKTNTEFGGAVIILTIILFISLMLGFIVNALSYLLLDDWINQIVDVACFQKMLRSLGSISYYSIAKFSGRFNSINYHFRLKNRLTKCEECPKCGNEFGFVKCLYEIKTRVSIERPNIVGYWGDVQGGHIMFRNFVFIMLFCLFLIYISFGNWCHILVFLIMLILILKYKYIIPFFLRYISLAVIPPLFIASLPMIHCPSGLGIIVISIISLNLLYFLSAFALTYYHYHIFIAAMYISSGENWGLPCTKMYQ